MSNIENTLPKISIIVPVYKVEQYLRRCLDSIVAQTFTDWECILIDDGSPDNCGPICDEYAANDKRFKVIHQENKGVSAARNAGLDAAKGEWIGFVDSDDWVEPVYIAELVDKSQKSNYSLIYFSFNMIKESTMEQNLMKDFKVYYDEKILKDLILNETKIDFLGYTWNKFFSNRIIKELNLRFIEGLNYREDSLFTLQFLQNKQTVGFINKALYNYRIIQTSLTYRRKKIEDYVDYIKKLIDEYRKSENLKKIISFMLLSECSYDFFTVDKINSKVLLPIIKMSKIIIIQMNEVGYSLKSKLFLALPSRIFIMFCKLFISFKKIKT